MARKGTWVSGSTPASYTSTTLALSMMPDACASWAKRARASALATMSGCISLSATFFRVAVCSAT